MGRRVPGPGTGRQPPPCLGTFAPAGARCPVPRLLAQHQSPTSPIPKPKSPPVRPPSQTGKRPWPGPDDDNDDNDDGGGGSGAGAGASGHPHAFRDFQQQGQRKPAAPGLFIKEPAAGAASGGEGGECVPVAGQGDRPQLREPCPSPHAQARCVCVPAAPGGLPHSLCTTPPRRYQSFPTNPPPTDPQTLHNRRGTSVRGQRPLWLGGVGGGWGY